MPALAKPRRFLRFSLRTLLVAIALLAVILAYEFNRAARQRRAVARLQELGGRVQYEFDLQDFRFPPRWLRERLGIDFFADVVSVIPGTTAPDETLQVTENFPRLRHVYLVDRGISPAGIAGLRSLTQLEDVTLGGASATDDVLAALADCPRLEVLSVHSPLDSRAIVGGMARPSRVNAITDAGLEHLANHTCIWRLDLLDTQVTDAGLANLKNLTNLESLWLTGAPIAGPGLAHLASLTKLRSLGLGNTQVAGDGVEHLGRMTWLERLSLAGTQVADDDLVHLKGMVGLKSLNLANTRVTDAGLEHLQDLPNLANLTLGKTPVTLEGVKKFEKKRPRCVVVR